MPEGGRPRKARAIPIVLVLVLIGWGLLTASGPTVVQSPHYKTGEPVLGPVTMRVAVVSGAVFSGEAEAAVAEALAAARAVDARLSTFRDDSELSLLNAAEAGTPVEVSPSTWRVLLEAARIHRLSGGAFDVSVGPLVDLYRPLLRAESGASFPDQITMDATRARVGFEKVRFSGTGRYVTKTVAEMRLDLAAIAKGYAVDHAVAALRRSGVRDAWVEIGGEVYVLGNGLDGRPWRVHIQDPRRPEEHGEKLLTLELSDRAVATSGDYQQHFEHNGKRYSHIIDPRTGRPVSGEVVGVTVVAPTCMQADALATALSVLGPTEGRRLLEPLRDVEVVYQLLSQDGTMRIERWPVVE